jgi:hypothetical protein
MEKEGCKGAGEMRHCAEASADGRFKLGSLSFIFIPEYQSYATRLSGVMHSEQLASSYFESTSEPAYLQPTVFTVLVQNDEKTCCTFAVLCHWSVYALTLGADMTLIARKAQIHIR